MRRFNLMKPGNAGDADDQAPPETNAAPPSRRRIFLLSLLLVVVVALGAKNLIGIYFGKEPITPSAVPERVVAPPADQALRPPLPPPMPAPVMKPEPQAKVPDPNKSAQSKVPLGSPLEKDAEGEPPLDRGPRVQEPVEPSATKAASQGRFSVQVGAMAHEANAYALRQTLEKLGYPVTIRKAKTSVTQHVVIVTATGDKAEADALVDRLKAEGVPASLGESEGRYRVVAGRSAALDQAIDLAHELQKKGLTPKITSETESTTLYLVRVGQFGKRDEASQRARELRQKGFPTLIVKR